ncbi:MAG: alcohol dehydrogenase catalytic domain-containing protein [Halobacteriovoraceae bacterium]|nr:alcohol dehydrogenase catalytic domain-containing protein [Halobacteriovoraceae bacterium]
MSEFEVIYSLNNGFKKVALENPPKLKAGQVLLRPQYLTICGSDTHHMEMYQGDNLRLGHEWVALVEEVSKGVKNLKVGDRVTATAAISCGDCSFCIEGKTNYCKKATYLGSEEIGALRSYLVMTEHNLVLVPKNIERAAVLFEVAAVGFEAVQLLKRQNNQSKDLTIFGCGSVGLMSALAAKKEGYKILLVDSVMARVERAKRLGFKACLDKELLLDPANKNSFSQIMDCTGDNAGGKGLWKMLPYYAAKGATAIMVGKYKGEISIMPDVLGRLGLKLVFMSGMGIDSLKNAVSSFSDSIEELSHEFITDTYNSDQVAEAFKKASVREESLKVLIEIGAG